MDGLSLPEVTVRYPTTTLDKVFVLWTCHECGHPHTWIWDTVDARGPDALSMRCDNCGHRQRMQLPGDLPAEVQLAQHVAERDTDPTEALIEPERPVFPRQWPDAHSFVWPEAEPGEQAERDAHPSPRARLPVIQDGQRLAQAAATIAERLMDRNWVQLRMDSSEHATDLIEMAAALKEFGA